MIPSTLFYEDTLLPAAKDVRRLPWSGLPNPEMPIAFLGCNAEENWIEEGAVSLSFSDYARLATDM